MIMSSGVKSGIYGISAIVLWITANLGAAFYVLVAAYIVDFALNYSAKQQFIQRMTMYLGSTFFAYYLQNSANFSSIPVLHGLIVMLAAHEVLEVLTELKSKIDTMKANKNLPAAEAAQLSQLSDLLNKAETVLPGLIAAQAAQQNTQPPGEGDKP